MQPPAQSKASLVETVSRPMVLVLRYLFFVLIFFLLLSIAAGLLMPGQEIGRYGVLLEPLQTCAEFERDLAPFNVNQVDLRVRQAEPGEFERAVAGGMLCWMDIAGVSEAEVSAEAAPVHLAARESVADILTEEYFYEPRHGRRETQWIWLLSLLLGAVFLGARLRRQQKDAEST